MSTPSLPPKPSATSEATDSTRHPVRLADAILDELVGQATPSIHAILRSRLEAAEAGRADALAPGPIVNRTLGRLVEIVTTGRTSGSAIADLPNPSDRAVEDRRFLARIESRVGDRLSADPLLAERAADLRRAAGLAETELERHHAGHMLDGTGSKPGATGEQSTTDDPLDLAMGGFPYLDNYRLLVDAELAGLATFQRPRRLTFCGAGALPLTGILAQRQSGATVHLVEIDPETAGLARAVLGVLGRRRLVDAALLRVDTGDAGAVDLSDTDVVVVASLVPAAALRHLVEQLSRLAVDRRPLLIVRSAGGLVGHFAYDPVDPSIVVAMGGYRHVGTVAPAGREPLAGPALLARADRSVLNTSEYFVPSGATHRR